jgi:hypothetical protein
VGSSNRGGRDRTTAALNDPGAMNWRGIAQIRTAYSLCKFIRGRVACFNLQFRPCHRTVLSRSPAGRLGRANALDIWRQRAVVNNVSGVLGCQKPNDRRRDERIRRAGSTTSAFHLFTPLREPDRRPATRSALVNSFRKTPAHRRLTRRAEFPARSLAAERAPCLGRPGRSRRDAGRLLNSNARAHASRNIGIEPTRSHRRARR